MNNKDIAYKLRRKSQKIVYYIMPHDMLSKFYFKKVVGYELNLKEPKTFNEKLQWLKLYVWPNNNRAIQCTDKYKVRDYVIGKGRGELLNEILYTWSNVNDINWNVLPNQFVLKCNHGCGYNILVNNKASFEEGKVKLKLNQWMNEDYGHYDVEPHYDKIEKRIICEKYLGDRIINYNIYVFNGKAVFLSVAGGLGDRKDEYLTYYNADGSLANFKNRHYPVKVDTLSALLPEMIKIAEFLSDEFPMVRVDLFDVNNKIILSELTFTPGGALIPFNSYEADKYLGDQLDILLEMQQSKRRRENK